MRRLKIGDVYEIRTPKGFAYMQLTHMHREPPVLGDLVRVMPGFYSERPSDLESIIQNEERFRTFIPINATIKIGLAEFVRTIPVPESKRPFPHFRLRADILGERASWWIWDGEKDSKVGRTLTEEQRQLPICSTWNGVLLVERIVSGWSHLDEV